MADFEKRWMEHEVLALVERGKSLVNTCKNGLAGTNTSVLDKANTISQEDLTRMGLSQEQITALQEFRNRLQAVYDAIVAQGF